MTPWLKQCTVVLTVQLAALSVGGAVSFPSVLLHQINTADMDINTASWIGSIHGIAGVPSVLMPCFMQWQGRRLAFIVASLLLTSGWLVACFAHTAPLILLSESLHGISTNSILTVSMLTITEMVSPEYKNICMVCYLAFQTFAMGITGVLAKFLSWRMVGLVLGMPALLSMVLASAWPESPAWLAWRGRSDECRKAHRLLRGSSPEASREIEELICRQKRDISLEMSCSRFWNIFTSRDFYVPCLHMYLLLHLTYWSGTIVTLIYAAQIAEGLNGDSNSLSNVIILVNFINFIGVTSSTVLLKQFNNKSVIVWSGFFTGLAQICGGLKFGPAIWVLGLQAAVSSVGLTSTSFGVAAELMPVRYRGVGGAIYVLTTCLLHASSMKAAPYMLNSLGANSTLFIYAANAIVCSALVWWCLPETKGKTLAQIESEYGNSEKIVTDDATVKLQIKQ